MPPVDWNIVKAVGVSGFVTIAVVWIAFWIIKKVLELGDKHLSQSYQNKMEIIKNHTEERKAWLSTIQAFNQQMERSASYQREEHARMIHILEGIEKQVQTSITK